MMIPGTSSQRYRPRFCRFTLLACFPSAVRVFFGSLEMVFLRLAADAAFLMFLRAAALCFADAMRGDLSLRAQPVEHLPSVLVGRKHGIEHVLHLTAEQDQRDPLEQRHANHLEGGQLERALEA